MAEFNTIDDFDVEDKTVLVRVDINAPVDPSSGIILDDTRLKLHAQTIKELSNKGAKVVLLAHQSRPGKDDFTTLSQHADALSEILNLTNGIAVHSGRVRDHLVERSKTFKNKEKRRIHEYTR